MAELFSSAQGCYIVWEHQQTWIDLLPSRPSLLSALSWAKLKWQAGALRNMNVAVCIPWNMSIWMLYLVIRRKAVFIYRSFEIWRRTMINSREKLPISSSLALTGRLKILCFAHTWHIATHTPLRMDRIADILYLSWWRHAQLVDPTASDELPPNATLDNLWEHLCLQSSQCKYTWLEWKVTGSNYPSASNLGSLCTLWLCQVIFQSIEFNISEPVLSHGRNEVPRVGHLWRSSHLHGNIAFMTHY